MAVKKPFEKKEEPEVNIKGLISKGARVKEDDKEKKWSHVNLRIPSELLNNIDEVLDDRFGISRNGWILEAIQEKLKRLDNEQHGRTSAPL